MIHREGRLFLIILVIILLTVNFTTWIFLMSAIFWLVVVGSLALFFFFAQFFRNPRRLLTQETEAIVSPADGTIVVIEKVIEAEYFKDERIQVSIFMSPMNVHLNRVPLTGEVIYYKYHPGKYLVAFHPKSSLLNERNTAVIRSDAGHTVLMRQIAGAVARRIRFYLKPGDKVTQGQELGFIKFGSRMDVFLPVDAEIKVALGDKMMGGVSVLAMMK
ncbi:MAG: phosphatidylserine decarboxylase family protein [Bacteroidota bacterium]|nr:phosphatidylserine decarboxylase family protein [Bacteroidota bacterium]